MPVHTGMHSSKPKGGGNTPTLNYVRVVQRAGRLAPPHAGVPDGATYGGVLVDTAARRGRGAVRERAVS